MAIVYVDTSRSGLILNRDTNAEFRAAAQKIGGNYLKSLRAEIEWPAELRTWKWLQVENQGNQGSCQGNALATGHEILYYLGTGQSIQFSRQYAYIASQKKRGINGDSGSVCSDGLWVLVNKGLPRETVWPYPNGYQRNPPNGSWAECDSDASNYKAEGFVVTQSYKDVLAHLLSGKGPIHLGMMWYDSIDRQAGNAGVIETFSPGGSPGGHSVEGVAVCRVHPETGKKLEDSQGNPYIGIVNSWSKRWGWNGWSFWSPRAIDAMLNHQYTEAAGVYGIVLGPNAQVNDWKFI